MNDATKETEADKSLAKSISFYPSKLFERIDDLAAKQDPKRSTSSLVCEAVKEYLSKHAPAPDDATAAAVAQVEAASAKDPSLAGDILQFIRDRKRARRTAGVR